MTVMTVDINLILTCMNSLYCLYFTGSIYLSLISFTLLFDVVVLLFLYYKPPWYISGLYSMRHNFPVGGASPVLGICRGSFHINSRSFLAMLCDVFIDLG